MNTQTYNRRYARKVKPRYLSDYKKDDIYIYTHSKEVFIVHLRYVKRHFKSYTVIREGRAYIIIVKEA